MNSADDTRILRQLNAAIEAGRPVALATIVETRRSVPRRAGTKMLIFSDGETAGTVGGGAMESKVVAAGLEAIHDRRSALLEYDLVNPAQGDPGICGGQLKLYLEPYMPSHTVYVIGCGHVGQTVVGLAHWLGYRTIAIDDRPDFVTEELLPNADVRFLGSVPDAIAKHPIAEDSSIIVVTRSPDLDVEIVPHLLDAPARYLGVMGSKTRWNATRTRLIENGASGDGLDRIHVPIGIELNAETLEEIAVSIMSEVIKVNRSDG